MRRRLRYTDRYACQARTVAGGSLLSSMASLCAFGTGMWLLIYSQDFVELLGLPLRDAFSGYSAFAAYMTITGIVGACAALVRSYGGLLCFALLLSSNLVCQGSIFAYLVTETKEVMMAMNSTVRHNTDCRIFITLEYKFDCKLDITEHYDSCQLDVNSARTALDSCSGSINSWLGKGVWAALVMAAILIAFQLLLTLTSLMLCHMIKETPNYSGGCFSRQQPRTAPVTLLDVTPAPTPVPHISHEAWYLESGPFMQGFTPRAPPPITSSSFHAHNHKQRSDRFKDGTTKETLHI